MRRTSPPRRWRRSACRTAPMPAEQDERRREAARRDRPRAGRLALGDPGRRADRRARQRERQGRDGPAGGGRQGHAPRRAGRHPRPPYARVRRPHDPDRGRQDRRARPAPRRRNDGSACCSWGTAAPAEVRHAAVIAEGRRHRGGASHDQLHRPHTESAALAPPLFAAGAASAAGGAPASGSTTPAAARSRSPTAAASFAAASSG